MGGGTGGLECKMHFLDLYDHIADFDYMINFSGTLGWMEVVSLELYLMGDERT